MAEVVTIPDLICTLTPIGEVHITGTYAGSHLDQTIASPFPFVLWFNPSNLNFEAKPYEATPGSKFVRIIDEAI